MILVDSSVLVDLLRKRRTAASDRLRELERTDAPYGIPLPCFQEILQGARDEHEWAALTRYLSSKDLVSPLDARVAHEAAARIFFDLRRSGLTVRSSVDCLIAQIALERNDVLLHDDADFEAIAKVRPLRTLRE